jgi:hypothetical protein
MKPVQEKDGIRIRLQTVKGENFYVFICNDEIFCSIKEDEDASVLMETTTRLISKLRQAGQSWDTVKDQLTKSSRKKNDIPALMLEAINRWEEK